MILTVSVTSVAPRQPACDDAARLRGDRPDGAAHGSCDGDVGLHEGGVFDGLRRRQRGRPPGTSELWGRFAAAIPRSGTRIRARLPRRNDGPTLGGNATTAMRELGIMNSRNERDDHTAGGSTAERRRSALRIPAPCAAAWPIDRHAARCTARSPARCPGRRASHLGDDRRDNGRILGSCQLVSATGAPRDEAREHHAQYGSLQHEGRHPPLESLVRSDATQSPWAYTGDSGRAA